MMASNSNFLVQLKEVFKSLSFERRIVFLTITAATILGMFFVAKWAGKPEFRQLYSNLSVEDAGAVLAKLKEQKIDYQISSNGSSIMIPNDKIYEVRMQLASIGLPQGGGIGFEIFDNTKLGMTEFVQNINYQRALQGELCRTIDGFNEVISSRVHIVMPSKSLFIEDQEPATASVVLKVHPGKWLTNNQIQGIVHLVSSSISGLSPEDVTVIDNNGEMLAGFKDSSGVGKASSDQLEYQQKVDKNLEKRIKTMLDTALGDNKSIVRVSCSFDFKKHEKTEEMFFPENKVARSEQTSSLTSNGTNQIPAGIPGVTSNITMPGSSGNISDRKSMSGKEDKTVNYEIGKVVSHIVEPYGTIKRISVAVLVDGIYKPVAGESNAKKKKSSKTSTKEPEVEYVSRSKEEMKSLESLVKRAVNFNEARGDEIEIVNIPFVTTNLQENDDNIIQESWQSKIIKNKLVIKYVISGFIFILTFFFIVRPLIKWITSASVKNISLLKQLPKTVREVENEYAYASDRLGFRDKALDLIKKDSEQSALFMKNWLKEK
jgi:flagellar M-ring protein FliF